MPQARRLPAVDPDFDAKRAIAAGTLAGLAYLGCMYVDMAITGSRSDDLLMIGRPLSAEPGRARMLGLPAHLSFGAVVGLVYAGYGRRRLSGSNRLRGIKMLLVENTVLWPLAIVADRYHPSMRDGELPRLNTPVPFAQQWARHIVFGYVLGVIYGDGKSMSGD
jgi:hypothetical protein